MNFSKETKIRIKRYILEKIDMGAEKSDVIMRTSEAFRISPEETIDFIYELEKDRIVEQKRGVLQLVCMMDVIPLYRNKNQLVDEDIIYDNYLKKYIFDLPDNIQRIWQYTFMEMMNNAIDHSEAEEVDIVICSNFLNIKMLIIDNGVGIFKKIKEYYNYNSLDDAVYELFKGKLTTDTENHSGEGIFFTSRVLDGFDAISDGKIFSHNNHEEMLRNLENVKVLEKYKDIKGTLIFMELSNSSNKTIKEVMDVFSGVDEGFIRTSIPIKNIYGDYPVSRSQARRLYNRFDSFQEVELDFSGISEIGQGFAHELFVVCHNKYPDTKLIPINVSEGVEKMINHVIHPFGQNKN